MTTLSDLARVSQLVEPALDHGRRDRRPASLAHGRHTSARRATRWSAVCATASPCWWSTASRGRARWEGKAAHEKLDALREEHGRGQADEANAFRREWDRQVRAGETKQYLPPSVQ